MRKRSSSSSGPVEPVSSAGPTCDLTQSAWEALARVSDPELHYDIVNLGLVYGVDVLGDTAVVRMTLTSPSCPYGPYLMHDVRFRVGEVPGIRKVDIQLVWEPPWGPHLMSEEARLDLGFDV